MSDQVDWEQFWLWWHDLPKSARRDIAGEVEMPPDQLQHCSEVFLEWSRLEATPFRVFNPCVGNWDEYVLTNDHKVWEYHQRMEWYKLSDRIGDAREHFRAQHNEAISANYLPVARCEGCEWDHPSQRYHSCLKIRDDK